MSFLAHYNLVTIHPWADGNGRMARLVMNIIQEEYGLIPSIVRKEQRINYIKALSESQEKKDTSFFVDFMLEHHIANMENTIADYEESIENDTLNLENDTLNDTLKLTEKEKVIIELFDKNNNITIDEIMRNTNYSRPTITRAISNLKEKGLIARVGAKKNGHWKVMK